MSKLQPSPTQWTTGNRFELLENGEEFFPAVFEAIANARFEIIVETFILFEDTVGCQLQTALIAAAQRGVGIDVTVDGYGSPDLSERFIEELKTAGVRLHIFDPRPRLLGIRTNIFRRLHRKIVAVDSEIAFIGGINFGADHLMTFGERAKQDYSVRIEGPLAEEIRLFARQQVNVFSTVPPWWSHRWRPRWTRPRIDQSTGKARLVYRDNDDHRDDIERHYRAAIRTAKVEVIIACAYFFPGYRLLRQLRHAARRGVSVKLILQGAPDMPQAKAWATMLYPSLLHSGVEIYEYCRRPLHAKIAIIDDEWCTIGSSNLDPLSLALNLEANIVVRDRRLNRQLRQRLENLLREHCRHISADSLGKRDLWTQLANFIAYHGTRHFPTWAGWLPAHMPKFKSIAKDHSSTTHSDNFKPLSYDAGAPGETYRH
jgi:cardiolipin synthase